MNKRLINLYDKLKNEQLDAILVSKPANIFYLSGFRSDEGYLLASSKKNFLIVDSRFTLAAKDDAKDTEIITLKNGTFQTIADLLKQNSFKNIGFESYFLPFEEHSQIAKKLTNIAKLIPTFNLIEDIRKIKDRDEIKLLKKAADIASLTMDYAFKFIKPGLKEQKVAAELEYFMKEKGAERASFEIIVACGKNSAYPHAVSSERKIKSNDMVLIDLGARFCGYNSDLTRMVFLDKITQKHTKSYEIILKAQELAIASLKPGKKISEIDKLARDFIEKNGLGEFFVHGLGHGLGIEVHELPFVNKKNNDYLQEGMVITIEPACYIPDWGGIRIEDTVLITNSDCEVLTDDKHKRL